MRSLTKFTRLGLYSKYRKKIVLAFLFQAIFFFSVTILRGEDPNSSDALIQFLKNPGKHILYLVEDFEGETAYNFFKKDSSVSSMQFIKEAPDSEDFKKESIAFPAILRDDTYSLEVFFHLEIPDREKIRIRPRTKKYLPPGIPIRAFFWVKSDKNLGHLKILITHPKEGKKTIDLGELNFLGWKRLEAVIPPPKNKDRNFMK